MVKAVPVDKGYLALAQRTGQYKDIDVLEIREGEYIGRDSENGKPLFKFIEDEEARENKNVIGYMAYFEMLNGFKKTLYWSKEKMEKHAIKYSQGYRADREKGTSYTFWSTDFNGMAFKTLLRQLISKWGIMSIELEKAYKNDMAVVKDNGVVDYVDNVVEESIDQEVVVEQKVEPQVDEDDIVAKYTKATSKKTEAEQEHNLFNGEF